MNHCIMNMATVLSNGTRRNLVSLLSKVLEIIPPEYHDKIKEEFDNFRQSMVFDDTRTVVWFLSRSDLPVDLEYVEEPILQEIAENSFPSENWVDYMLLGIN